MIEVAGGTERPCTLEDLASADEAFIASTTREVQPVAAIDEPHLRRRRAGHARVAEAWSIRADPAQSSPR